MSDQVNLLITLIILMCYLISVIKIFQGIVLTVIKGHKGIYSLGLGLLSLVFVIYTTDDRVYFQPFLLFLPVVGTLLILVTIFKPGNDYRS